MWCPARRLLWNRAASRIRESGSSRRAGAIGGLSHLKRQRAWRDVGPPVLPKDPNAKLRKLFYLLGFSLEFAGIVSLDERSMVVLTFRHEKRWPPRLAVVDEVDCLIASVRGTAVTPPVPSGLSNGQFRRCRQVRPCFSDGVAVQSLSGQVRGSM